MRYTRPCAFAKPLPEPSHSKWTPSLIKRRRAAPFAQQQAVGHRLAVAALGVVYKQPGVVFSGPRVVSVTHAAGSKSDVVVT